VQLNIALFGFMSVIWGSTWIAAKAGIAVVPPVFFLACRYVLVVVLLAPFLRGAPALLTGWRARRVVATGLLIHIGTNVPIFWAMQYVSSGIAALVNLSTTPLALFGIAIALGQERANWRHAAALALGLGGLVILFAGKADMQGGAMELWGAIAIVGGSVSYSLGSVLARPLLATVAPLQLTAAHSVITATSALLLAFATEPVASSAFHALLAPAPLAGLVFLVLASTFVAHVIFMRLVRDWGAPTAGLYAFVSPVVALALGAGVYGEPLGPREIIGGAVMLLGAAIALIGRSNGLRPAAPDVTSGRLP
jgi:drug/metabolite transporter (DMT)-like permease